MSWLVPESFQSILAKLSEYSSYYLRESPSRFLQQMEKVIQAHLEIIDQLNLDKEDLLEDLRLVIKHDEGEGFIIAETVYLIPNITRQDFLRGTDNLEIIFEGESYIFLGIEYQGETRLEDMPQVTQFILQIAHFTDVFGKRNNFTTKSKQDLFRNLLLLQSQTIVNRGPGVFRGLMNTKLIWSQLEPSESSKKVTWHEDGYFEVSVFYTFTVNQRKQTVMRQLEQIGLLSMVTNFRLFPIEDHWEWGAPHFYSRESGRP